MLIRLRPLVRDLLARSRRSPRSRRLTSPTVALVSTGLSTLVATAVAADTTIAALLLLLSVVASSLLDRLSGLLAAVAGFVSLAWFFAPPEFAVAVRRRDDLVAFATYLFVATVTGSLVARATELRHRAELHEAEALLRLDLKDRLIARQPPPRCSSTPPMLSSSFTGSPGARSGPTGRGSAPDGRFRPGHPFDSPPGAWSSSSCRSQDGRCPVTTGH